MLLPNRCHWLAVGLFGALASSCTDGVARYAEKDSAEPDSSPADTVDPATVDADDDGFPASEDCNDHDDSVWPGHWEDCNGEDDDCDGAIDEDAYLPDWEGYADADGDGYGVGELLSGCGNIPKNVAPYSGDCAEGDPLVNPGGEDRCDGLDNDCDGDIDYPGLWYGDADGDGWGVETVVSTLCAQTEGFAANAGDCDDGDATVSPSGVEVCDGLDQDCDGVADNGPWYADSDLDGWGDDDASADTCSVGWVVQPGDCDDADASRNPDVVEECDGVDQDCDTRVDEHLTCTTCADDPVPFDVYVPDDVPTIQAALDGALDGDRICVREGTYYESVNFLGKNVLLYGEAGAARTTIDAGGAASAVVTFTSGETADAVLQGFTLVGGSGNLDSFEGSGTTDYCSSTGWPHRLTLWCGGGVAAISSSPTLTDLVVRDMQLENWSSWTGGRSWAPVVYDEVGIGGGFCFRSSNSVLTRVDAVNNRGWNGGVAFVDYNSAIEWTQSVWSGNSAGSGGGLYVDGGSVTLTNIVSDTNHADGLGGFLYAESAESVLTNVTSLFDISPSAALDFYYGAIVLNNVLVSQPAANAGIDSYSYEPPAPKITYSLSWGEGAEPFFVMYDAGWVSVEGVNGNFSSDPQFVGVSWDGWPGNDDMRLGPGSPAIDAGDPALLDADGTRSDIGAFGGPGGSGW